jgi:ATP-dependent helicase/DNAse subunit B
VGQVYSDQLSWNDNTMRIKGRFDAIMACEDGSYGIIDYKISEASEEEAAFYSGSYPPSLTHWKIQRPAHYRYRL